MSDDPVDLDEDELLRGRATWAVVVLVLVIIIVGSIVVLMNATPGSTPSAVGSDGVTGTTTAPASHHSSPTRSSTGTARLAGDEGNLLRALNRYRAAHGRRPVSGSVSTAAQRCASSGGAENACPTPYYWEPVPAADGHAVLTKITASGRGVQWLLDPSMTAVQIGWAKGTDGLHLCAVIKRS